MKSIKQYLTESSRTEDFRNEWLEFWNEATESGDKEKLIGFYEELLQEMFDEEWHHKSHTPNREEREAYSIILSFKREAEDEMESKNIDYEKIYKDFKSKWKEPKY